MLWQKICHGTTHEIRVTSGPFDFWLFEVALRLSRNCAIVQSLYWIVIRRECDCCEITSKLDLMILILKKKTNSMRLFWDEKAIIYMVARFYWDCREIRLLQDWRLWDCDARLLWDEIVLRSDWRLWRGEIVMRCGKMEASIPCISGASTRIFNIS